MMRQFQTISCGNGDLEPTEECDDGNTAPGDGCSDTCELEDEVSFYGRAEGGNVTITVDGVVLVVPTTGGQLAGAVAAAIAAAIEADPTLAAAGVTAFADGQRLVTTGTIDSVVVNDAGLGTSPSTLVPALSGLGLVLLVGALVLTARQRRSAR
jgi:cysteine-rich repeat protein